MLCCFSIFLSFHCQISSSDKHACHSSFSPLFLSFRPQLSTGFSISSRFSFSVSHKLIRSETPSVSYQIRSFLQQQGDF
ncbi:hypothetical protein L1987_29721 [Smallanthus sonchifolius]|uniref:Uncharacterized protein n=1 Tax=Smallanthus sonchifolius TaxID=185202 RepID=A0ACB9I3H0_9ASTR|nr:hypothetical protein L1987_29721 [Smallanthus sonchifolius]